MDVILRSDNPLDDVARGGVEKEGEESGNQEHGDDLDDQPLVVAPQDVTDRL